MNDKFNADYSGDKTPAEDVQTKTPAPAQPVITEPAPAEQRPKTRVKRRIFAPLGKTDIVLSVFILVLSLSVLICAIVDNKFSTAWSWLFEVKYGHVAVIVCIIVCCVAYVVFSLNAIPRKARIAVHSVILALLVFYAIFASVCYAEKYKNDALACVAVAEWVDAFEGFSEESDGQFTEISSEYNSFVQAVQKRVDKEKWTDIKEANDVYRQITAIGTINSTGGIEPANEKSLYKAKSDYEALSDVQRGYVSNYEVLTYAVERYEYLCKVEYSVLLVVRLPNGEEAERIWAQCKYFEPYKMPSTEFTAEHYNFAGWSLWIDATEPEYKAGDPASRLTDESSSTVTFYAVWKGNPVTIHCNVGASAPSGAYLNGSNRVVYYGDKVERYGFSLPYTRHDENSDYYAVGWYTYDGRIVYHYENGIVPNVEGVTDSEGRWILTEEITLYAHWAKK